MACNTTDMLQKRSNLYWAARKNQQRYVRNIGNNLMMVKTLNVQESFFSKRVMQLSPEEALKLYSTDFPVVEMQLNLRNIWWEFCSRFRKFRIGFGNCQNNIRSQTAPCFTPLHCYEVCSILFWQQSGLPLSHVTIWVTNCFGILLNVQ